MSKRKKRKPRKHKKQTDKKIEVAKPGRKLLHLAIECLCIFGFAGTMLYIDYQNFQQHKEPGANYLGQTVWPGFGIATVIAIALMLVLVLLYRLYCKLTGKPFMKVKKVNKHHATEWYPRFPWQGRF